jgi:hypothetical protein
VHGLAILQRHDAQDIGFAGVRQIDAIPVADTAIGLNGSCDRIGQRGLDPFPPNIVAFADPIARTVQPDGRIRHWYRVDLSDTGKSYILRVVTLEDGETVHNAFFDRDYRETGT